MHLDSVLREESVESLIQVQESQASTDRIIYRRLFVAIILFGVGMAPAVILTRRGSQFGTRRRRHKTLLEQSINPIQIVDHEGRTQ